jgi:hypothetical protein
VVLLVVVVVFGKLNFELRTRRRGEDVPSSSPFLHDYLHLVLSTGAASEVVRRLEGIKVESLFLDHDGLAKGGGRVFLVQSGFASSFVRHSEWSQVCRGVDIAVVVILL